MTKQLRFPKGFWWGAATSGPQSEGTMDKPHQNVMDAWFEKNPEAFFDGVGSTVTSDFYHQMEQDLALLKSIGFNSFRTSIQWSRLIDDLETGSVNQKAVAYYHRLIDTCDKLGIELVLNLHHFDLPVELLDKYGGWESRHVVDLFVLYAKAAFEQFGQKVRYFTTFNEPMVIPEAGYLYGFHYPNYVGKGKEAIQVIYHINLASALAIKAYRKMNLPGKIGIILNLTPAYPRSDSEQDRYAAKVADELFNKSFLEPAIHGQFTDWLMNFLDQEGVLFTHTKDELDTIKQNTIDYLGVNYYHPKRVKAPEINPYTTWMPDQYSVEYQDPTKRMNPYRGWEIYPQAIYEIAKTVQNDYGNLPWFISENGMGVENEARFMDEQGFIQDDYRIEFYEEHLSWLHKAIEEGSNCFGFHAWTAIDCWSWNNAYKNRYGFVSLDLASQKRSIKKSGYWYQKVSQENGFEGKDIDHGE